MRPILFQWRCLTVWSYPVMLYAGLVSGVVAGNAAAHVAGIDGFRAYVGTLVLIICALFGARLLYVATNWYLYRQNLRRVWNRSEGGAAMYGGLYVALLGSVPLLAALKLPFGVFWDVTVFAILVGMIFGRIGCFLNGCCAGRPSRTWFSVNLPNHLGVWTERIPTQCLEAGWAAFLLISAMVIWRWLPFPGALFLLVTAGYCCGRLVLESLREPDPRAKRFNIFHGLSVVMILLSLATLTIYWPK